MEIFRAILPDFFKVNAAILTIILAALALGPNVQDFILRHLIIAALAIAAIEVCAVALLIYLHRGRLIQNHFDDLNSNFETIESLHMRFADAKDFSGTDRIYREWFKLTLAVQDSEFCKILDRGQFVRVLEARHRDGSQRSNVIVGYYSVWPLSMATFESIADGNLQEQNIVSADVLVPSDPLAKVLYVSEICVSQQAWKYARGPLMCDFASYIGDMVRRFPNIEYVAAWPYSDHGQHYVKKSNMTPVGKSRPQKFYWAHRDVVLTNQQTHRRFKSKWSTPHFPVF